jgi:hypothetical protein
MDRIEDWLAESQLISPDPEPWPALELACIESEEHPPPIVGRQGSIDSILDAVDRSEEHPPPIVGRRASIDSRKSSDDSNWLINP